MQRVFILIAIAVPLLFIATRPDVGQSNSQPSQQPAATPAPQPTPPEAQEPDDVIRIKTSLVTSPVHVLGYDGKYIPHLRREDFHVFEDGVEQPIAYFASVDSPFTVTILIDISGSTIFKLEDIQDAAISFVDKLRPNDRVLIMSFSDEVQVLAGPTSDRELLRRAIRSTRPAGNSRVYDAVEVALKQIDPTAGRKAVILFSDGVDNASREASLEHNLRDLDRSEALVYPIQFSTYEYMRNKSAPFRRKPPEASGFSQSDYIRADAYLHQLAAMSGTRLYPAADINHLEDAVAAIVDELHNEYSLGYYPQTPGRSGEVRRVDVRVNNPRVTVHARTGYVVDESGKIVRGPTAPLTAPAPVSETGSAPVPRTSERETLPAGARWICKGPNVPGNFAVVKEGFDSNCAKSSRPHDENNAWFIRKPGPTEVICKGFLIWQGREIEGAPIPTGYVVVGQLKADGCTKSNNPKEPANAWSIRVPGQAETICKGFQIPRGYVVIGETTRSACPVRDAEKNAWLIIPKEPVFPNE